MLIKFFARGQGSGSGPVEYAIRHDLGGREANPPEIVRGDADRTTDLIDSIDREWRYTSGVVSFALEDAPSVEQQAQVMDEFEQLAFAGLDADQYDILWVRHQHTEGGRVELHFVTPRMELTTGKALNIAPPGWESIYGPLVRALNAENGWARPDDPDRARELQKGPQQAVERFQSRDAIHGYISAQIEAGAIYDRSSLVQGLFDAGLEVNRQGKDYVTALDPETGDKFRLKGTIYEQGWTREQQLERTIEREARTGQEADRGIDLERAQEARSELSRRFESRIRHHQERYPRAEADHSADLGRDAALAALDSSELHSDRSDRLSVALGRDMVDESRTDRDQEDNQFRAPSPFEPPRPDPGYSDRTQQQRRVSDTARKDRDELEVSRSRASVPQAASEGMREDGEPNSIRARVAAFRQRLEDWYRQGNSRLKEFFDGLRHERDEQHREALNGHRERARDSASALTTSGATAERHSEANSGLFERLRNTFEQLRTGSEQLKQHTQQIDREVTRQQEQEKQREQERSREYGRGNDRGGGMEM